MLHVPHRLITAEMHDPAQHKELQLFTAQLLYVNNTLWIRN